MPSPLPGIQQDADLLIDLTLHDWKVDFSTVIIESLPASLPAPLQRPVDIDHVNHLAECFGRMGIFGQNSGKLKGILLSDLPGDPKALLQGARVHLFIGQHRGLATQKALNYGLIAPLDAVWTVSLYKKELLDHAGLLGGLIDSDNAETDVGYVPPLPIDDQSVLPRFFSFKTEDDASIYCRYMQKWSGSSALRRCLRPGVWASFHALCEVAPWVVRHIAYSGLRDLGNGVMSPARIVLFFGLLTCLHYSRQLLCTLIAEITEWWQRLSWDGNDYGSILFGQQKKEREAALSRNPPKRVRPATKTSKLVATLSEQLWERGADLSLVESGPNVDRQLVDPENGVLKWSFPDIPTHKYISAQLKNDLAHTAALAGGAVWLLYGRGKSTTVGTAESRFTRERGALMFGGTTEEGLLQWHKLCWRMRNVWVESNKSEILKSEENLERLLLEDERFRNLVLAFPCKDIQNKVAGISHEINQLHPECLPRLMDGSIAVVPPSVPAGPTNSHSTVHQSKEGDSELISYHGTAQQGKAGDAELYRLSQVAGRWASSEERSLSVSVRETSASEAAVQDNLMALLENDDDDDMSLESLDEGQTSPGQWIDSRGEYDLSTPRSGGVEEGAGEPSSRNSPDPIGDGETPESNVEYIEDTVSISDSFAVGLICESAQSARSVDILQSDGEGGVEENNDYHETTEAEDEGEDEGGDEQAALTHKTIHETEAPMQRRECQAKSSFPSRFRKAHTPACIVNSSAPAPQALPSKRKRQDKNSSHANLSFSDQRLYNEILGTLHKQLQILAGPTIGDHLRSILSALNTVYESTIADSRPLKRRRYEDASLASIDPRTLDDVGVRKGLIDLFRSDSSLFIVGAGISTCYGLPTFRDESGRYRAEYKDALNWSRFVCNEDGERKVVWTLAKRMLEAQRMPRGKMHTLLNWVARAGRAATIISTNIDNLEVMNHDVLPAEYRSLFEMTKGSIEPFISSNTNCFLQLHGSIDNIRCSFCGEPDSVGLSSIDDLIEGRAKKCPKCSSGRRPEALSAASFWRPAFTFYDDVSEARMDEDRDGDYQPSGEAKSQQKATGALSEETLQIRYGAAFLETNRSRLPSNVFIIGSSLANDKLLRDVRELSKRTRTFVINPSWNARFSHLSNCKWIKATAEDFASVILEGLRE